MAEIPDKLLMDIRKFFAEYQGCNEETTVLHDKYIYAIDLTAEYDAKEKVE